MIIDPYSYRLVNLLKNIKFMRVQFYTKYVLRVSASQILVFYIKLNLVCDKSQIFYKAMY